MAGPPNSVAVASAYPNSYFADVFGAVAHFPSTFQVLGWAQPSIPSAHYDVDSTGRTLPPLDQAVPRPRTMLDKYLGRISDVGVSTAQELPQWWLARLGELRARFGGA